MVTLRDLKIQSFKDKNYKLDHDPNVYDDEDLFYETMNPVLY